VSDGEESEAEADAVADGEVIPEQQQQQQKSPAPEQLAQGLEPAAGELASKTHKGPAHPSSMAAAEEKATEGAESVSPESPPPSDAGRPCLSYPAPLGNRRRAEQPAGALAARPQIVAFDTPRMSMAALGGAGEAVGAGGKEAVEARTRARTGTAGAGEEQDEEDEGHDFSDLSASSLGNDREHQTVSELEDDAPSRDDKAAGGAMVKGSGDVGEEEEGERRRGRRAEEAGGVEEAGEEEEEGASDASESDEEGGAAAAGGEVGGDGEIQSESAEAPAKAPPYGEVRDLALREVDEDGAWSRQP